MKPRLPIALLPALVLVLTACTSAERRDSASLGNTKEIAIVTAANRFLELEPCGCPVAPWGGVEREWNALKKIRAAAPGRLLEFSVGTTFMPSALKFNPTKMDYYRRKADFLVEALNGLGTSAVSPSADNLLLGIGKIKELESKAAFPFVSTNLFSKATGKPLFTPYLEWQAGELSVLVLGAARVPNPRYGIGDSDVDVKDPAVAIAAVLAKLPKKPRFVVVLSSLTHADMERLKSKVPEIRLVLGGTHAAPPPPKASRKNLFAVSRPEAEPEDTAAASLEIEQPSPDFLYFMPLDRGRNLGYLTVEARPGIWALKDGKKAEGPAGAAAYEFTHYPLDKSYEGANKMSELVSRYKEAVRQQALQEAGDQ